MSLSLNGASCTRNKAGGRAGVELGGSETR